MSKSDLQCEFLYSLGELFLFCRSKGIKITMGRGYASEAANKADGGHEKSCHLHRLAMDINLFDEVGNYVSGDHPYWRDMEKFWKEQHPLARWGGDFSNKDYNHFSFEFQGVK